MGRESNIAPRQYSVNDNFWKVNQLICKECGTEVFLHNWAPKMRKELEEGQLCGDCYFWTNGVLDDTKIVIDGKCYHIDKNEKAKFKGFGGRMFKIRFLDGTLVETTNLWANGKIPERFRERFPDNAKFVDNLNFNLC